MLRIRIRSAHNAAMLPMIPLVNRVSCFELEGELELGSELEIVLEIVVAKVVLEINVDVLWVRTKKVGKEHNVKTTKLGQRSE